MIVIVDAILGLLLAVSALLLAICLVSYRRSGVRAIVISCYFLVASLVYDVAVLVIGHWTDWLLEVDEAFIVILGAIILAIGVTISRAGGRLAEGSS